MKNERFWRQFLPAIMVSFLAAPLFSQQMSDSAARQISDILTIKRSLSGTQRKLSSSLIMGAMAARHQTAGALPQGLFRSAIKTDTRGQTLIDLKTTSIAAAEQQILALGGEVVYSSAT